VYYTDEKTPMKVLRAIVGEGTEALDLIVAFAVVDRVQEAGILFVEPVPAANKNEAPVQE
jgi:hypothetical protein